MFAVLGFLLLTVTGSSDLTIRPGETLCGEVKEDAPAVTAGGLSTRFRTPLYGVPVLFTSAESGRFTIAAESLECDLYLAVLDEKGDLLTDCDDGPVWTDSRVVFDTEAGKRHTIHVCVLQEVFGRFTLRAALGETSVPPPEEAVEAGLARGRDALAHCEKKFGVDHFNTLAVQNKLGLFYQDAERYEEARKSFERSMELNLARHGEEHWLTSRAYLNMGVLLAETGDIDRAITSLSRSVEIIGKTWKSETAEHVGYVNCLCHVLVDNNRHREAILRIIELIALCEDVHGAKETETAWAHIMLGDAYYFCGLTGAIGSYVKGLEILEARLGRSDVELLQPLADIVRIKLYQLEDPGAALPFIERGLQISISRHGKDNAVTSSWRCRLATCHLKTGDIAQADRILSELIAEDSATRRELEKDKFLLSVVLATCGRLESARACWLESLRFAKEALALREESEGAGDSSTESLLADIASCLGQVGRSAEALRYHERALELRIRTWGESHPFTAITLNNIGALCLKLGRDEEALKHFERVLDIRRETLGADSRETFESRLWLVVILGRLKRLDEAEQSYDALLSESRRTLGQGDRFTAKVLLTYAEFLRATAPVERVRPLYEEAVRIREAALGENHSGTINAIRSLARYLFKTGNREEASALFEVALKRAQ